MNRARRLVGLLLLVGACPTFAARAGGGEGDAGIGPRLVVEPPSFDFGRARPRRELRQQFRLRNFGDRELRIDDIRTDCGCTAALLETPERTIAPGASATLDVRLQTGPAPGPVVRRVLISSNDPQHKAVELKLTVDVQREKKKTH